MIRHAGAEAGPNTT